MSVHLVCKDVAVVLGFEQGKGKLILVNHAILRTVLVRLKHHKLNNQAWEHKKAQQAW